MALVCMLLALIWHAFWHSGWVGRLASICPAPTTLSLLVSFPRPTQRTWERGYFLPPRGRSPSIYDYSARCTPRLGGQGVVVNFNPTLSQPVMSTETLQLAEDTYTEIKMHVAAIFYFHFAREKVLYL